MASNKPKLPAATDWQARDISDWNVSSFTQFIIDRTQELYGVTYAPGGGGSVSQRWLAEKGMLKNAQGKYGNTVLRRFFEICWREYKPSQQYPYITVMFALSYLDRYFTQAQTEIAKEARRADAEQAMAEQTAESNEDLKEWW